MCTALSFLCQDHYFGRNLDLEYQHNETVAITPRRYPFPFRHLPVLKEHYALIGIATVSDGYPLYYEATNEMGLSLAGLNFHGNAYYHVPQENQDNIAPYELIPYVLGQCANVAQALAILENVNLVATPFSEQFPLSDLHWLLSDREESYTLEPLADGLKITKNPIGVLTNNPPFPYHLHNLSNYMALSPLPPENRLGIPLEVYSRGMGAIGLPGDLSSASRFIRASFTKQNSLHPEKETEAVSQFFHILGSVCQQAGCVRIGDGFEKTVYSSCCNTDRGIFYYTCYDNSQITAVHLHHEELNASQITKYPLRTKQHFLMEN